MCRLFGFRSVIQSGVHRSLLDADNALGHQSGEHPDGWGVAYYVEGTPHVTKSPLTAMGDQLFHRLSGVVSSQTVLAHVRRATRGSKTLLNCHPFQYGRWVFAHNGDVPHFEEKRELLLGEVAPHLRRFILGETDSEVIFYMLLTRLSSHGPLAKRHGAEDVAAAISATIARVRELCDRPGEERAKLTVMLTDGETLVACHGGRELQWSSYKTRCADRDSCPSLSPECEAPTATGYVNHLIVSSEPLSGENIWLPLAEGDLIGVDWRMRVVKTTMSTRALHVASA